MESKPARFYIPADGDGAQVLGRLPARKTVDATASEHTLSATAVGATTPEVRLGLLLDGLVQERWVVEAVRATLAVPGVHLAAIATVPRGNRGSMADRLHRLVDALDGRLRTRHEPLLSTVDVAQGFHGVPRVEVSVERTTDGWTPDAAGMDALRSVGADVWLCVCAESPRRPLPGFARHVLGLEVGIDVPAGNPWAGAAEVEAGSPVTVARVVDYQIATGTVYQGIGATIGNSARRNRLVALRRAIDFLKRSLIAVTRTGPSAARAELPPGYPADPKPTVARVAKLGWRLAANIAANRWFALRWQQQWQVGFTFGDGMRPDMGRLRYLVPPRDRLWADPFAVTEGKRHFIFFEELRYSAGRGSIAAVEIDATGTPLRAPQTVLERPYHMSYPFLFRWRGGLYMLPETAENGTVELYRCEELPSRWRLERVLLNNIRAYDATLWQDRERWWMFVSVASHDTDGNDELHLYSSNVTPLGPWTPHPENPVIVDTRRARSAGPLFVQDGALYRPSQDCSVMYGHAISINRVDTLSERDYRETPVERIEPDWRSDIMCVHTLGGSGRLRVVDMMVKRPRWPTADRLSG